MHAPFSFYVGGQLGGLFWSSQIESQWIYWRSLGATFWGPGHGWGLFIGRYSALKTDLNKNRNFQKSGPVWSVERGILAGALCELTRVVPDMGIFGRFIAVRRTKGRPEKWPPISGFQARARL